jgi:hypothetical protein
MRAVLLLCLTGCVVQGGKDVPPVTAAEPLAVNPATQEVTLDTTRVPDVPDCPEGAAVRRAAGGGWECVVPFRCKVNRSTAEPVAPNAEKALTFDTRDLDIGNMYDAASPRRVTIPAGGDGTYLVVGEVSFAFTPLARGFYRIAQINVNGVRSAEHRHRPTDQEGDLVQVTHVAELKADEYVELSVQHDAEGSLNVVGFLSVTRIR